jgi:hypothetical protein
MGAVASLQVSFGQVSRDGRRTDVSSWAGRVALPASGARSGRLPCLIPDPDYSGSLMIRFALTVAALASTSLAQHTTKTAELPLFGASSTNSIPFGEKTIRYQQWYSGAQLGGITKAPVRIVALQFVAPVPTGLVLDIEVTMANASNRLSGSFQNNFLRNKVVTVPRTSLTPSGAGGVLEIPFSADFVYDGVSDVVVELRIFDNGLGRFTHTAKSTVSRASNTYRQYFIGNANATNSNSAGATHHYGLVTRFSYQEGGTYEYGTACTGGNGFAPIGSVNEVPLPGLPSYTQHLTKTSPGFPCIFLMGVSNTVYGSGSLPLPLSFIGVPGCSIQAAPHLQVYLTTGGGSVGTGTARLSTPIPAIGTLAGFRVYSQWIIFDHRASNGVLSTTKGLMHVVGS